MLSIPVFPMSYIIQSHIILLVFLLSQTVAATEREIIGKVLDRPVYRDQIADLDGNDLRSELHILFVEPVLAQYSKEFEKDMEPSQSEIDQFIIFYKKAA